MNKKIVLAAEQDRFKALVSSLENIDGISVVRISSKNELNIEYLSSLKPDYIFFPQWNWIIPADIYTNFNCVMFHMTDLPYGRGGSPLQNLIVRGKTETMLSAFKCDEGIDSGPVYLKKPLSLSGTAEEIFKRAIPVIVDMIKEIVTTDPAPMPQKGEVTHFQRRKPEDGDISRLASISDVYDYIRMLDADSYPAAFIELGGLKFEFSKARKTDDEVIAEVRIKQK